MMRLSRDFNFFAFVTAFCLCAPCIAKAQAVIVHVRVVNGKKDGPFKTWLNVYKVVDGKTQNWKELSTDSSGVIAVEMDLNDLLLVIPGNSYDYRKEKSGSPSPLSFGPTYSVKKIMTDGITETNNCGKVSVSAKPGELVIFERPLTFWEAMKT
jgi:hypothetical protein